MKIKLIFFIILIVLFNPLNCASKNPYKVQLDRRIINGETYSKSLKKWTKSQKVFVNFETKAHIDTTYKSPQFVQSYLKEIFIRMSLDINNQKKLIEEDLDKSTKKIVFFVSMFTPDLKHNDINSNNSIWNIKLVNDKNDIVYPEYIFGIDKGNILKTSLYPYITPWSRLYEISFPLLMNGKKIIDKDTKYIQLIIAGLDAQVVLKWNL